MLAVTESGGSKDTTFTFRSPPWTYLYLTTSANHSKENPSSTRIDEITLKTHLNSALNQYLGLTGTAIPIDILKVADAEAWVRMPHDDERAVVAALSQWSSKGGVAIRVKGRSSWLGSLVGQATDESLWSMEE